MKLKNNLAITFSIKLLLSISILFIIHIEILNILKFPMFDNKIVLSYVVNFLMASVIFTLLYSLKNKFESLIGFFYLGGSFLKFAVFFLLLYPFFRQDNQITKPEIFSFLAPYFLCLIMETYALVKLMNYNE